MASCLLRVVQEGITNALKHSDASRMVICLTREDNGLRMLVQDNGRQTVTAEFGSGIGLEGMAERIRELGGQLQSGSTGQGFRLLVEFPEECLS